MALNATENSDLWSDAHAEDLPDFWYEPRDEILKRNYRKHVPQLLKVEPNGKVGPEDGTEVWFEEWPFLLCLRCGSAFDGTERDELKKLFAIEQCWT